MAEVQLSFLSAGCNQTVLSAAWRPLAAPEIPDADLVAYASNKFVHLCTTQNGAQPGRVVGSLCGHQQGVYCVKWLSATCLISGSADHTLIVWDVVASQQWILRQTLEGHTGPVTYIDGITTAMGDWIASCSTDSTLRVWLKRPSDHYFACAQTLSFGSGIALCVSLALLPHINVPVLAVGRDDTKVHLMFWNDASQFVPAVVLQGHEDWVRGASFALIRASSSGESELWLATCSQDTFIRIWRISTAAKDQATEAGAPLKESFQRMALQVAERTFTASGGTVSLVFGVKLEALLSAHDEKVYSVCWVPPSPDGTQAMCLLSSSMDKTMVLWQPDETGVWTEELRVGAVGGTALGLYGAIFNPHGNKILGHGFQGAFHVWSSNLSVEGKQSWTPEVAVSGHFGPVADLDWAPNGTYLLTTSEDETTRLFGEWKQEFSTTWHELARPQVHGYGIKALAILDPLEFASGADEKVVRVFQAPQSFVDMARALTRTDLLEGPPSAAPTIPAVSSSTATTSSSSSSHSSSIPEPVSSTTTTSTTTTSSTHLQRKARPVGASVPALGLSNKAVFEDGPSSESPAKDALPSAAIADSEEGGGGDRFDDKPHEFQVFDIQKPSLEENLQQNTLWPEVQKLYGHGYEIFALAADHSGRFLASACKSTTPEQSVVRLWDRGAWNEVAALGGHTLTVTSLAFSHNDQWLASASRDRNACLFRRHPEGGSYSLAQVLTGHDRIIWAVAWAHDDSCLATASRDKTVKMWAPSQQGARIDQQWDCVATLKMADSITAIDFAPSLTSDGRYVLCCGTEQGLLYLYGGIAPSSFASIASFDPKICHGATINRVRFRPCTTLEAANPQSFQMASCSTDHSVRIFTIVLR